MPIYQTFGKNVVAETSIQPKTYNEWTVQNKIEELEKVKTLFESLSRTKQLQKSYEQIVQFYATLLDKIIHHCSTFYSWIFYPAET